MTKSLSTAEAEAVGPRLMRLASARAELGKSLSYTAGDLLPPSLVGALIVVLASVYWEQVAKAVASPQQFFVAFCLLAFGLLFALSRMVPLERRLRALTDLVLIGGGVA